MLSYKYRVDIFNQIKFLVECKTEFVISNGIMNELFSLSKNRGKTGMGARFALKLIEKNKNSIILISSSDKVDEWIFEYAKENNAFVCTDDARLKTKLKREKIKTIVIKSKSVVDFE
jgi:rRNA-processing protein FCF1